MPWSVGRGGAGRAVLDSPWWWPLAVLPERAMDGARGDRSRDAGPAPKPQACRQCSGPRQALGSLRSQDLPAGLVVYSETSATIRRSASVCARSSRPQPAARVRTEPSAIPLLRGSGGLRRGAGRSLPGRWAPGCRWPAPDDPAASLITPMCSVFDGNIGWRTSGDSSLSARTSARRATLTSSTHHGAARWPGCPRPRQRQRIDDVAGVSSCCRARQ